MDRLNKYIDPSFPIDRSIVLRYHPAICSNGLSLSELMNTSLKEGVRIFWLCVYKGVDIFLLDESTLMYTGTYKSIDGCISIALCKKYGFKKIVYSSGANTGIALTAYAKHFGIETFFFHPRNTLFKIKYSISSNGLTHLISPGFLDKEVKAEAKLFSDLTGVPLVPRVEWRMLTSRCRALAICEEVFKNRLHFAWISQAVCAGFGPLGIYEMFRRLIKERILKEDETPKFLGIQQKSNSPMVKAWNKGCNRLMNEEGREPSEKLIEPALYNTFPRETYPGVYNLLNKFGGCLFSVSENEYNKYKGIFISFLSKAGIELTTLSIEGKNEFVEKAGLICGIGILKAIDKGIIKKGEKVLCSFTGGISFNNVINS